MLHLVSPSIFSFGNLVPRVSLPFITILAEVICMIASHFILTFFMLQVVVAAETGGALGGMVRQLSIDQFENEGRRVSYGTPENATAARKLLDRQMSINSVPKKVFSPCH